MRRVLLVVAVGLIACLSGCGEAQPLTAGGKPVSHWVQALQGPDAKARKKAATELGNVGSADPAAVPALAGALKDRDAGVRAEAALALLRIGPAAREAVPALEEAAQKDREAKVRDYAARALEKVRGER
jgi:HEAT repeat protein